MGLPLFHNHLTVDLVKTLFEFGSPEFISLREEIWVSAFSKAAQAGKSFIFTFNPENTVAPDLIPRLEEIYRKSGGAFYYVELLCSDDEVMRRINNESRKRLCE